MFFLTYTVLNAFYSSSTALVLAVASLGLFSTEADAAGNYCYRTESNATVCIHSVFSNNSNYKLVEWSVDGGNRYEEKIFCNPSHRYSFKENLAGIACFRFS